MPGAVTSRLVGDLPLRSANEVASALATDATVLTSGFGSVGYPKAVPRAIARSERDFALTIVSGGSVGDEIDHELLAADAVVRRFPYQARPEARERINDGRLAFHDRHVSHLADEVQYGSLCEPDVAVVEAVAVGPDWLVPSTSIGHTPAFVAAADRLVVEVNEAQPLALQRFHDCYRPGKPPDRDPIPLSAADDRIGSARIAFDPAKLSAVVETDDPDDPYSYRDPTETDLIIAENLAGFLSETVGESSLFDDAIHFQFGVGSLGNALIRSFDYADFGDRNLVYYGEVIPDGLLDVVDSETFERVSGTSLALSKDGQERLFEDVGRYDSSIVLRPADVSNSPEIVNRLGVVAVNSALEVDVYGHVNSTHVDGTRLMNGVGGSGDFVRNSPCAIVALPSTAADGEISRIVPMVPHVDHTEHDIAVVVTEHGVADLRGSSPIERAESLIENCAHPDFRPRLEEYLSAAGTSGGHIHHDLDTAFDWQTRYD